eukprot:CAMPEP_0171058958 /NCGR_PEP_ID=MMETSP0766_2-20121228/2872_1 /TAXON_ID=439317 /ORGANISM="Gambierdiscus australes, Strain CAWD 149" /LENGTH=88 /DNA_ID=CAMNT_0011514325 /DNA_START=87 /DNA_END=353 /DNA_ORIENTATION=-
MSYVAWGDKYNGVDNVFANVQFSHIANGHGQTLYGGNSDHNALNVIIDLAPQKTKAKESDKESKDKESDQKAVGKSKKHGNATREVNF